MWTFAKGRVCEFLGLQYPSAPNVDPWRVGNKAKSFQKLKTVFNDLNYVQVVAPGKGHNCRIVNIGVRQGSVAYVELVS